MTKKFMKSMVFLLCFTLIAPLATKVYASEIPQPPIVGEAAVTMDLDTGEVIYSKNADLKHSPASTTKLLTSLLFAENKTKTDSIPYTDVSASLQETTLNTNFMGNTVKPGDSMNGDDVMKAVMIFSANDAAIMMAESVAGSVDAFANMMNEKAKELGAVNSHFLNPHGLEVDANTYNYTTAYDLALIAKAAYANPWIKETMALDKAYVTLDGKRIDFDTRNKILGKDGNVGGKTGTETMAGHCFVGFFNKDGRNLVTVVLGSEYGADGLNVFNDTITIANYGYSAKKTLFKSSGDEVSTVDLQYKVFRFFGPVKTITVPVVLSQDVEYYKNDFNDANAKISFTGDTSDAWKIASKPETELTFTSGNQTQNVSGTIVVKTADLIKENATMYIATVLISIIIISLIVMLVVLINKSKRKNRRNRYYR